MAFLIPIFVVGYVMATICFIAYVVLEIVRGRQRSRATVELQGKLIDRLGEGDVAVFLTSDNGGKLLQALAEQPLPDSAPLRVMRALQGGLVLLSLGVGMFIYSITQSLPDGAGQGVAFAATLATTIGVGLLAAARVSYGLSKRLGLLGRDTPQ